MFSDTYSCMVWYSRV